MKTQFRKLFSVALVLFASLLWAQKTVTGTVTDSEGFPVSDATVTVKQSGASTVTDLDGNFSITANEGDQIEVDALNSAVSSQTVGASSTLDFTLGQGGALDEVVVTALGLSREKKSLGYATQTVDSESLSDTPVLNFADQLSGEVAGLDTQSFGSFGSSSNLIVRGYSSLYGTNQALVVVDGIVTNNDINSTGNQKTGRGGYDYGNNAMDVNPNDIESIEVLKGSAATALYGSRAQNGALIITTKKGRKRQGIGVSVTSSYMGGWADKTTLPKYQKSYGAGYGPFYDDPTGYFLYEDFDGDGEPDLLTPFTEDASYGAAFDPSLLVFQWNSLFPELDTYKQKTPWIAGAKDPNSFVKSSSQLTNSVSFGAGNETSAFKIGWVNDNTTGILPNSLIKRNTFNISASHKFTDKLEAGAQYAYTRTTGRGRFGTGYSSQNPYQAFRQWWQVNTDMAEQRRTFEQTGLNTTWNTNSPTDLSPIYTDNAYWMRYNNYETDERNRNLGNVYLNYKVNKDFGILGRISRDAFTQLQEERVNKGASDVAMYSISNGQFSETNYDLILSYNKDLTDRINLDAIGGWNLYVQTRDNNSAVTNGGLIAPGLFTLDNSLNPLTAGQLGKYNATKKVDGLYGRLSFGFQETYYLEGTFRRDRSSTLPIENNSYNYFAISGSMLFSKLVSASWLSYGKLRANYATNGNSTDPYNVLNTYTLGASFNGLPTADNSSVFKNAELKPEYTKEYEFGLETQLFKNRLGFDISYYNRTTDQLLTPVSVTTSTGASNLWFNAGKIENKGIEFFLNATPVSKAKFKWDLKFNFARNRNKVLELAQGLEYIGIVSSSGGAQGGISIGARVGDAYGVIRGRDYVYLNGERVVYSADDAPSSSWVGMYQRTANNDEVLGDINPDWTGGVKNSFTFGNVSLGFLIDIQKGGDVFSLDTWYGYATGLYDFTAGTNDLGNPVRNGITNDNTSGGVILDGVNADGSRNTTRAYAGWYANPWGYARTPNAAHVYDASFVKLREASLTYRLPKDLISGMGINNLSFSIIGRNLWIIHKNVPFADPEAGQSAGNYQGNQSGSYPSVRQIGASINFDF